MAYPQRGSTQHKLEQQLAALEVTPGGSTQPGAVTTETSYSYSYKTPTYQGAPKKFAPVTAPKPRYTATGQQNGQKAPSPPPPPGPDSYSTILSSSRTDYNNSNFQFAQPSSTSNEDYLQHGQRATKGIISATNTSRNKDPPPPIPPRGTAFYGHQQIGQPPPPPPKPKIRPQYNTGLPTYKPTVYGETTDTTDDLPPPPPPPPPPEPETYASQGGTAFPPPPPVSDDLPPPPPPPGVTSYTYTKTETHQVPQSSSPPPPPPPPAPTSYEPPPSYGQQKYSLARTVPPAQSYSTPPPPPPAPQTHIYQPREPQPQTYHRPPPPQTTTYAPPAQPQPREAYQPPSPPPAPASTYVPMQSKYSPPGSNYPPPANTYAQPTSSYAQPSSKGEPATTMYKPSAPSSYTVPKPSDQPIAKPDKTGTEAEVDALTNLLVQNMENAVEPDFFGTCAKCEQKVSGDDNGCSAMDKIFHINCFTCETCQSKLRGKPFYALEGKAYCEECYLASLEKCSVCSTPIMDRILRATGKPYHPACFTCVVCGKSLDGVPFTVDATNQIHCIEDFHKKFAPRCSVCQQPIMPEHGQEETVRIVAMDRSFHVQCYKCEDCGLLLSSDADGRGCYPLDDHILCRDCNAGRIQTLTSRMSDQ